MTEKCDLTPRRAFQKCLVFDDDGRKYSKHFNNWTEKKWSSEIVIAFKLFDTVPVYHKSFTKDSNSIRFSCAE